MNRGIMERSSLMPRKSLDIRFTDQPVLQKRGQCALFLTSGEDRFGQSPIMGQGTSPLQVHRAAPYALGELSNTNICSFQGSFEPIFSTQFFHRLLDTTLYRENQQCSCCQGKQTDEVLRNGKFPKFFNVIIADTHNHCRHTVNRKGVSAPSGNYNSACRSCRI